MDLNKVRRMAAQVLKVGENKVRFDPLQLDKAREAMTKEDVRSLIKEGVIKKKKSNEQSRARARKLHEKKKKGRKKGSGKRKGSAKAREKQEKSWMKNVRAQRKKLKELKKKGKVRKGLYQKTYKMIKGNYFKGKKYVEAFVLEKKVK
jgi:large subunit ribosomal protein L19e